MDNPTTVSRAPTPEPARAGANGSASLRVLALVSGFPKLSETFVVDQILGLARRGAHMDIWALDDPSETALAPEVTEHGLLGRTRYLRLPERAESVDDWLVQVERSNGITPADLERYDVVHLNFGPVHLAVAPLLESARVPLVASFYGYDLASFVIGRPDVYRPLFGRAEAVTAVSESGRRRLVELGCPIERAHVQRAGVRLGTPSLRPARSDGPLELLVIARLVDKKGVDDAIRALQQVQRPARLRIIGDGPLRPELEALSDRLGVGDRVVFEGAVQRARVERALNEADVVVQLSRTAADGDQEGIPVALVMAAAAGAPIVATRHSGIPELVADGVAGLLVDERDVAGAARAIERIADDEGLGRRLGTAARSIVERDFDQDRLDDQLHQRLVAASQVEHPNGVRHRRIAPLRRGALDRSTPVAGSCPVCDVDVTFPGADARCPNCGSSAATRTVARFLIDRSEVLGPTAHVLSIEADPHLAHELTQLCGRHDRLRSSDVEEPPPATYDLVLPPAVSDATDTAGLAVLAAAVAPRGWCVVAVACDEPEATPAEAALRAGGLTVLRHDPLDLLPTEDIRRQGLDAGLVLLVGVRPAGGAASEPREASVTTAVVVAAGPDDHATSDSVRSALSQRVPTDRVIVATSRSPWVPPQDLVDHPRVESRSVAVDAGAERLRSVADSLDVDLVGLLAAGDQLADRAVDAARRTARRAPDAAVIVGDRVALGDGGVIERYDLPEPYHRTSIPEAQSGSFVRPGSNTEVAAHAGAALVLTPVAATAGSVGDVRTSKRRGLRIVVRHNPDKAGPLLGALRDAGHELVADLGASGDVVITDLYPNHGQIWELMERVGRTILYPHSAWPTLHCDGIYPVHPSVEAYFVVGQGCVDVMEALDFPAPVFTVGWPFGELRPLRPTPGHRVLFGAHHPDRLGHLARRQKVDNERIVDELVDGGFEVTVRHIGSLRENGLRRRRGVTYHQAGIRSAAITRPAELDLDAADVVVSAGTFAHKATALGIPVVTCGQQEWAGDGMRPDQRVRLRTWPRYSHLLRYPFDADTDLAETVRRAATDLEPAQQWRRRFMGEPFDAAAFVRRFEEIVG